MQRHTRSLTLLVCLNFIVVFLVQPTRAANLTLSDGSIVNYVQNGIAQGGTGNITGTLQQGGASSNFSCAYDAVSGQISGSTACATIIAGLDPTNIERQIVDARVHVTSNLQAETHLQILDDLIQRHIGGDLTINVRTAGGSSAAEDSPFGGSQFGSWGLGAGSFLDDNRTGLEKAGHDYVATVGLDHAAGNTLIGGYIGYMNTELNLKSLAGHLSSEGWLLGAYVNQALSPRFSLTISGSYGDSDVDMRRTFASNSVTAQYGHTEWSGSFTANANLITTDDFNLAALGGLTYGAWKDDAYTDSRGIAFAKANGDNTYVKAGVTLTIMPGMDIRPYGYAIYDRLLSDPAYSGRDALNVGGGLAVGSGRLTGSIEAGTLLLRTGQSNVSIGVNLRLAL